MPVGWQPSTLAPQNAEAVVVAALDTALTAAGEDVHVDRAIPTTLADRMVIVTRDGGRFDGITDRARLRVRVFDVDDEAVGDLSSLVVKLVANLVPVTASYVDHQSGPVDVTDGSEQPQRYHLFEVHLRGEALP